MRKAFDIPTLSGAERLFAALFPGTELSDIPLDVEDTIENALDTLAERSNNVIHMRYWEGLTVTEIAEQIEKIPDDVRNIIGRSLNRLRNKAHAPYIKHGEKFYRGERYKRLQDEIAFEKHEVAKLEQELADLHKRKAEIKVLICRGLEVDDFEEVAEIIDSDNIRISELGLSVRVQNAIEHNGIHTIGELREFCREKCLLAIRHLGRKGAEEVLKAVDDKTGIPLISGEG